MAAGEPAQRAPMTMTSYIAPLLPGGFWIPMRPHRSRTLLGDRTQGLDVRGNRCHRRVEEHLVHRNLDAQFLKESHLDFGHDHGLAAQGEEIFVDQYVVALEFPAPDAAHPVGNHHSPLTFRQAPSTTPSGRC